MEFPDVGQKCSWSQCKMLDFLPFTCAYCNKVFCKDHFNQDSHSCESFKSEISKSKEIKSYICSIEECTTYSPVEMLCEKCSKHFCLVHRYHDCFDKIENLEEKKKKWKKPREQFAESVKVVHDTINEKIKKAVLDPKKQATALKIQLMRLKAKAQGQTSIPTTDRTYFLFVVLKDSKSFSKPVFVNKEWNVGKVIDYAAKMCAVTNHNNEPNSAKLRLFKKLDGKQISDNTDIKLSDLINNNIVANGECLILEYVPLSENVNQYELKDVSQYDDSL